MIGTRTLELAAADREALLHDLLSEVLYLAEAENLVFSDADIVIPGALPLSVRATLQGDTIRPRTPYGRDRGEGDRVL